MAYARLRKLTLIDSGMAYPRLKQSTLIHWMVGRVIRVGVGGPLSGTANIRSWTEIARTGGLLIRLLEVILEAGSLGFRISFRR